LNGRPYGVEWYPTDSRGEACHDLHVDTNEWMDDIGVEVITSSNDLDYLVSKWERHRDEDRLTFWIFDRRETACRLWNELDYRGEFYLDGQFRQHGNWSAQAINRKLWRSSNTYREEPGGDLVHTVTGLLEGDEETIQAAPWRDRTAPLKRRPRRGRVWTTSQEPTAPGRGTDGHRVGTTVTTTTTTTTRRTVRSSPTIPSAGRRCGQG